jgi:putative selenate reductase
MDCARAAKRNRGVESVTVVYRRTREFMPSQYEEQEAALAEGVIFDELLAPVSFENNVLVCEEMRFAGWYDASGRRGIAGTGRMRELPFDTVICAVGARVDAGPFVKNGIALNEKGFPLVTGDNESSAENVFIAGDCKAGASTIVRAIADGKTVAAAILRRLGLNADFSTAYRGPARLPGSFPEAGTLCLKKGALAEPSEEHTDGFRCLSCDRICDVCVDVCPNRANVTVEAGKLSRQIVHIDRMCNECGNCAAFCPHAGKPYRDKFTVFSCPGDFEDSENPGFVKTGDAFRVRLEDKSTLVYRKGEDTMPPDYAAMIETITGEYSWVMGVS